MPLWLTGDPAADHLLDTDPFALLVGMLLDQQVPMEAAFAGPKKLADRMGGLDVHRIAEMDPDEFAAIAAQPPGIHRFARSMAGRVQGLARHLVDEYDGDPARIWIDGAPDAATALHMVRTLHPHVTTIDVAMPGIDGISLLDQIRDLTHPVMLSSHVEATQDSFEHGALGFFDKNRILKEPAKLIRMVEKAADGHKTRAAKPAI